MSKLMSADQASLHLDRGNFNLNSNYKSELSIKPDFLSWELKKEAAEMGKLIDEIQYDLNFIKSHTLQPKWYKLAKVFIILGFLAGYYHLFGLMTTVVFFLAFMLLSTLVHFIYRTKTRKYTQSWLDFTVVEEGNQVKAKSIGKYYYATIIVNTVISMVVSQLLT